MGKAKLNPAVHQLTGKVGNLVFRELWGEVICGRPPDFSGRVLSADQRVENAKYVEAGEIWQRLSRAVKDGYRAWGKRLNKPPYALFNKNHSIPPMVESIDLSAYTGAAGESITVSAHDIYEVAGVEVIVREAGGDVVERGEAIRSADGADRWLYQTKAALTDRLGASVEAVARNWPNRTGNRIHLLTPA